MLKAKAYVMIDGLWVQVYPADTWQSWAGYGAAFALLCVTIGIWL
jgi:hypothetical protein